MDSKKSIRIQYILIIVLALLIAGILFYMIPFRYKLNNKTTYDLDNTCVENPLMGFAPMADHIELCKSTTLVFIELTWAEWEPEKGKYDIDALEKKFNIARWKEEGKHAVLRFVCDLPGEQAHMDIPKWLYDQTGDGTAYDNACGKGYSPAYENEIFMSRHEMAMEALAAYCNEDDFVAFIQLGSIGHWGEWHAQDNRGNNLMPDAEVCLAYANQYSDNFVNAHLLTRRNYDFAVENGMGFYNDMVGDYDATQEWLSWIENGGFAETSGEALALKADDASGMQHPVGGELTSAVPMNTLFGDQFGEILGQISASYMTFLGPNVPDLTNKDYAVDANSILRRMGYRIYMSAMETQYDFSDNAINVKMTWKNEGNSGFFFEWPVTMNVYNSDQELIYWQTLDLDLRKLNDGTPLDVSAVIPYTEEISDEFYVGITIHDPEEKEFVTMAIKMEEELGWIDHSQLVYHYQR